MDQNERLNKGQSDAVMHADGPCVVIAPPGSGKTKVLTLRVGALIKRHGVSPKHILVVTFTRAAAQQMRKRYLKDCKEEQSEVTFGTFHAVFFRILQESLQMGAKLDGCQTDHSLRILTEKEKKQILTAIVNQTKERRERFSDTEQLCAYISRRKNRKEAEDDPDAEQGMQEIWAEYCDTCKRLGVLDFEDITDCCARLLQDERNVRILAYWRERYRYFLVDEFQDVSPTQFSVLRMIAAPHDHLFVVGDDDQSIYGFRGADTGLMLSLPTYYPTIRMCYLTVNYRSGRRIVDAAGRLIAQNRLRYEKEVTSGRSLEGVVRIVVCSEKKTQTRVICDALFDIPETETAAVIVRTNAQAAEMERLIGQAGILACTAHGNDPGSVYEHPAAKDVLAYLTLAGGSASGQECMEAMLRIINKPYRAVSRRAVIASGGSMEALCRFYDDHEQMMKTLHSFQAQLQCLSRLPPFAALAYICRGIGYERSLPDETVRGGMARAEAIRALRILRQEAKEMRDQREWLYAAADGRTRPVLPKAPPCKIQILTMHACKGLEFDHVVIPNLNEGVIPNKKAFLPEEIEEERRLLYVAMTRARKTLLMTCIHKQGDQKFQMSRFLRGFL